MGVAGSRARYICGTVPIRGPATPIVARGTEDLSSITEESSVQMGCDQCRDLRTAADKGAGCPCELGTPGTTPFASEEWSEWAFGHGGQYRYVLLHEGAERCGLSDPRLLELELENLVPEGLELPKARRPRVVEE